MARVGLERVWENNDELTSFDTRFREIARQARDLQTDRRGGVRDREKVRRETFRRGKLSATRYYDRAIGIAELYGRYFFLPRVVHFSDEAARRNRDLQSASKLGHEWRV